MAKVFNMRRYPLFWQIAIPVLLVFVVSGALAVYSALRLRASVVAIDEFSVDSQEHINVIADLDKYLSEYRALCLKHLASENASRMGEYYSGLQAYRLVIGSRQNQIYQMDYDDAEALKIIGNLRMAVDEYMQKTESALRYSRDFEKEQAFEIFGIADARHYPFIQGLLLSLSRQIKSDLSQSRAEVLAEATNNLYVTIAIGIAGVSIMAILIFMFFRALTRRLDRVLVWSERFSKGDHGAKLVDDASDEIGRLVGAINRMSEEIVETLYDLDIARQVAENSSAELRQAELELKKANETLEDRVRQRTEELKLAMEEAKRSSNAKSEFLSRMSHELRTPLNAIMGFSQVLKIDENLTADQLDSLDMILSAGKHLLELINEVLDLAKVESGKMDISLEAVDLKSVLAEVCILAGPLSSERHIELQVENTDVMVMADRMRLKQVLLNMVSNAIKYNRDNGAVRISFEESADERLRISVTDTGYGISEQDQADLFKPFSRVGDLTEHVDGVGIGLVISKHLVNLMGGEIRVSSQQGVGSTFVVELDVADSAISADKADSLLA